MICCEWLRLLLSVVLRVLRVQPAARPSPWLVRACALLSHPGPPLGFGMRASRVSHLCPLKSSDRARLHAVIYEQSEQ